MPRLLQHRLDPASRLARLMFAEYGVAVELEDIKPWTREPQLLEINPAATVPILIEDGEPPIVGILAVIHAIEDRYAPSAVAGLFPAQRADRAEMWRLLEWVLLKLNDEVTRYVLEEKIVKRDKRGATPEPRRAAGRQGQSRRAPALFQLAVRHPPLDRRRHHDAGRFRARRPSLERSTISATSPGRPRPRPAQWYARIKSRPAFRTLLNDRVVGMPAAAGLCGPRFLTAS